MTKRQTREKTSGHAGEADELLRCAERNNVKLKYCNSELVDPACGKDIMAAAGVKGRIAPKGVYLGTKYGRRT